MGNKFADIDEGFDAFEEEKQRELDERRFEQESSWSVGKHTYLVGGQVTHVILKGVCRVRERATNPFDYEEGYLELTRQGVTRSIRWTDYGSKIELDNQ